MEATLNIDPRDGDMELLEVIERVFEVRLQQQHVGNWRTLGDVHETLLSLLPQGSSEGRCPTSMAFYRLRAALIELGEPRRCRPATTLEELAHGRPKALLARLGKKTGLDLPDARLKWLGTVGTFIIGIGFVTGVGSLFAGQWIVAACLAAAMLLGLGLVYLDPGELPSGVRTLGDLAERAAALSRAKLRDEGARQLVGEEWSTLVVIAAEQSGLNADELGPETYIFRHVYEMDRKADAAI